MTDISTDLAHAKITGLRGEAPDTQGVTTAEAKAIIANARGKHVGEGEIYSSFASLGLSNLYQDAARGIKAKPARGSVAPPDNADTRSSAALSDARRAYDAHRLTPAQLTSAMNAMDALAAAATSGNLNWTTINVGDDDRAHQILSRANDATGIARRMYYDVFGMSPGAARDVLVSQARQLLEAAERLGKNDFVKANAGGINVGSITVLNKEIATLRSGLRERPQS